MLTRAALATLRKTPTSTPNKLKLAMKLAGVTQVQLSQAINLAQSQISEDATGKSTAISVDKAHAYAEFFGCAIDDLFPAREAVAS